MLNTVYVKVIGFRDVERHALNTVFRLSQDRSSNYVLWSPDGPQQGQQPHLVLLDTDSYEGGLELESPGFNKHLKLIAVGERPPEGAWRAFVRPINWTAVVHAMDQLFAGATGSDIDLTLFGDRLNDTSLMRLNNELDDLLLPYKLDVSLFANLTHPELIDHIRRVGVVLYERQPVETAH